MFPSAGAASHAPSVPDARLGWALLVGAVFFASVLAWALGGATRAELSEAVRQLAGANPHQSLRRQVERIARAAEAEARWLNPGNGDFHAARPVASVEAARGLAAAQPAVDEVGSVEPLARAVVYFPMTESGLVRPAQPAVPPPRSAA